MTETTATLIGPDRGGRWVLVNAGVIAAIGNGDPPARSADTVQLACPDAMIEPGWVNAHTHVYSGLAPLGMPQPVPPPEGLEQILQRVWWRLDRALDAETLAAAARLYAAGALLRGCTTLIDHHESPNAIDGSLDVLADAFVGLGMRAVLCYGATERNGGRDEAERGLAECRRFIRANDSPLLRGMVGLHAGFTVSDETIGEAGRLCGELRAPLHLHLAEGDIDVEDARGRGDAGPLERLVRLDALPPTSILAHGVHLNASQVEQTADRRCYLVHNPRSNRGNGVGYPRHLGASHLVALGTDGYPADRDQELEALFEQSQRHGDTTVRCAERATGGRGLLARLFDAQSFDLEAGAPADLVVRAHGLVTHVWVAGRLVVAEGELHSGDMTAIRAQAGAAAKRLWRAMEAIT